MTPSKFPRMGLWLLLYVALFVAALVVQDAKPGSLAAVTLFKAHLMALGGWGGYWLDRALFPYDRPHAYRELDPLDPQDVSEDIQGVQLVAGSAYGMSMLRRAIIVAACLICVGLGA